MTGVNDQKFGFTLGDGHAAEAVKRIVHHPLLTLAGLHCHIGSQITDAALFGEAIRRMIATMADIRARHGVILSELNIGGGHGVPYVSGDPELDPAELSDVIDDALDWACAAERFPRPRIVVEPGRAISARAGVTLYRVIVGEVAGRRAHVRRGGRRHVRQSARQPLRCEIHCGTCQPALSRPDPDGHRGWPALRSGRRDRP